MIIITENKKNHYMIKKFLEDFENFKKLKENYDSKIHPVLDDDNLPGVKNPVGFHKIITDGGDEKASKKHIEFVSQDKPRNKKILNKFIQASFVIPFMAAVLLYNSPHENSEQENEAIILIKAANKNKNNNDEKEEKIKKEENKENVIIDYEKDISFSYLVDQIKKKESFRSTPYPDHKQWSIGYGSRVSDNKNSIIDKEDHKKLRPDYDDFYNSYSNSKNRLENNKNKRKNKSLKEKNDKNLEELLKWTAENYPDWYNDLHGKSEKIENYKPLSQNKAEEMLIEALKKELNILKDKSEFDYEIMPSNIKEALSDMSYNMGGAFIIKFKKFHEVLKSIDIILKKKSFSKMDIDILEKLFESAANEIKDSKYYNDLTSRASENETLVRNAKENFSPKDKTFQNESLKSVYKHLFV